MVAFKGEGSKIKTDIPRGLGASNELFIDPSGSYTTITLNHVIKHMNTLLYSPWVCMCVI